MSNRLKLAFEEASKLPEAEQDEFAAFLLAELDDEKRWRQSFARSQDVLSKLAAEARKEHAAGKTRPLEDLLN
jgi:hypothetical protein